MASYPFSEIMVGDKFNFEDEGNPSPIKIKTSPTTYRMTGDTYVGNGNAPEPTSETSTDLDVDPSTPVVKLLDLADMIMQIQHEIWEVSLDDGGSYSEVLDRVIESTSDYEDQETELVHKVACMIRKARESGLNGANEDQ